MTPDDPIPLSRRKGCWVGFLAGILLLVGLAWMVEDQAGKRRLAKTRARLAAEGRVFDPEKVYPVRPPDDQNFGSIPLLVDIGSGNPISPEYESLKRIAKLRATESKTTPGNPKAWGREFDSVDWQALREAFQATDPAWDPSWTTDAPERDLAAAMESRAGAAFTVLESAVDRPHAIFLPTAREEFARRESSRENLRLNVPGILDCMWALEIRSRAALALRDSMRAVRTLRVMLRLADAAEAHGYLLASVVGISVRISVGQVAWLGLRDAVFEAQDLPTLQKATASYDGPERLVRTVEGEAVLSALLRRDFIEEWVSGGSTHALGGPPTNDWRSMARRLIPQGWFDFNEATVLVAEDGWIDFLRDTGNPRRFARNSRPVVYGSKRSLLRHDWLATAVSYDASHWASAFASNTAVMHFIEIACALERCREANASYPPSLEALVPAFLGAVPSDLDSKPIRYALDPSNRRYRLWSVGVDATDEGGVEKSDHSRKPKPWREQVGDWVWQYR